MATNVLSRAKEAASQGLFSLQQDKDFSLEEIREAIDAGLEIVSLHEIAWKKPSSPLYGIAYNAHHS